MSDERQHEPIALVDMDGTIVDFDEGMRDELEKLRSPGEPEIGEVHSDDDPPWLEARRDLIKRQPGFWRDLGTFELGFEIVDVLHDLKFEIHLLTKGPRRTLSAWTEKVEWAQKYLAGASITITHDKGLVYGKVLVDDWPPYVTRWLEWRPRGLVIMPAQPWNETFTHPQTIRYDGKNIAVVRAALRKARETASPAASETTITGINTNGI